MYTKMERKEFEKVNCVVCGTYNEDQLCTHGQFGLDANVVICKNCGLSYLNPRWTKEKLWDFYVNDYDKYYRPNMDKTLIENSLYKPVFNRLKERGYLENKIENILDIGSGEGANLQYLLGKFPDANFFAIEPSPNCQKSLKAMGVEILGEDIELEEFKEEQHGTFDLICMRHVLEHFQNPIEIVQKISRLLKDDGVLYIAVPNSLNFGKHPIVEHCFRTVHTFYFNIHTLSNVLSKANVEISTIYEGDAYNEMEIIAVVKKGEPKEVTLSPELYHVQKKYYDKKMKEEKALLYRLKRRIIKVIKNK